METGMNPELRELNRMRGKLATGGFGRPKYGISKAIKDLGTVFP
jgi:hypothetical protein